jgi:hypothetical protein
MRADVSNPNPTRGRPPHLNRVAALRGHEKVIKLTLSMDIAERLILEGSDHVSARLGTGEDRGKLVITKPRTTDGVGLFVHTEGRQITANIRSAFLGLMPPDQPTVLDHIWRGDELVIDLSPLPPLTHYDRRPR